MLAHDVAAPDRGKADIAALARPGQPVAPAVAMALQRHAAPLRRRLPKHQRGARRRVHLHPVMCLDDLDIPVGIQRLGHLARQPRQQIDPEAHVARAHNDGVTRRGGQLRQLLGLEPRRADDMDRARLRGQRCEFDRRRRGGEVDHRLRLRKSFQRIVGHGHAIGGPAHRLAQVAPDPGRSFAFHGTDQPHPVGGPDQPDEHAPHPARHPGHHDARQILLWLHLHAPSCDRPGLAGHASVGKAPLRGARAWPKPGQWHITAPPRAKAPLNVSFASARRSGASSPKR